MPLPGLAVNPTESDHTRQDDESTAAFIPSSIFGRMLLFGRLGMGLSSMVLTALAISTVLQVGPVVWLVNFVDSPPPRSMSEILDDRFVQMMIEEEEEEIPEQELPEEEEEEPEPIVEADPELVSAPEPEAEPEPEPEPEPQPEVALEVAQVDSPPSDEGAGDGEGGEGQGGMNVEGIGGGGDGSGPSMNRGNGGPATPRVERREDRREEREEVRENRDRVAQVEDLSQPPCSRARRTPALPYPDEFREEGVQGRLRVQCVVTLDGELRGCRLRRGDERLFAFAQPRIERVWRCSPGLDASGDEEQSPASFNVSFNLES
ncbi:MAG: outer membrane biosynthesis protein TonB [Bradymonadia bacterium]|jgi:outer membrane biosynthesis protein TonB